MNDFKTSILPIEVACQTKCNNALTECIETSELTVVINVFKMRLNKLGKNLIIVYISVACNPFENKRIN